MDQAAIGRIILDHTKEGCELARSARTERLSDTVKTFRAQHAILVVVAGALFLAACRGSERPDAGTAPKEVSEERRAIMQAIRDIDAMRSSLAAGINGMQNVDQQTFAQVCKPVGARLKQTAHEQGWDIRQIAVKYRNVAHAPDQEAKALFSRFESNASLDSLWIRTDRVGESGWRYLRRITVEPACLACHGAPEARPEFIKENYPEDRAFGFEPGDLRGLYSVFIADSLSQGS